MATTRSRRHRHKYHLVAMGANHVWACALPDCTHYMPNHMEAMVEGKASICWQCGEDMILDKENMKDKQPRCYNCKTGIVAELPMTPVLKERLNNQESPKISISEETILSFLGK